MQKKAASKPAKKAPVAVTTIKPPPRTVNSLTNEWVELEKHVMICAGNFSQNHKKHKYGNQQSAANCIVACAYASLKPISTWVRSTINEILETGTELYHKTRQVSESRCIEHLTPPEIYKYFYLGPFKISMKIAIDKHIGRITRDSTILQKFEDYLRAFFSSNSSGIVAHMNTYFAIWKADKYFYVYDPVEHDSRAGKWGGLPGLGFAYCIRSPNLKYLANLILQNCALRAVNKFIIYPCVVEKCVPVNTKPPDVITVQKAPEAIPEPKIITKIAKLAKKPSVVPEPPPPQELEGKKSASNILLPPQRPKLQSVTRFVETSPTTGILRASTHQRDPNFTRYMGAQSFGNALAALTMLRYYKSKKWVRRILDDVLRLGEQIHHDQKKLPPGEFVKKITLYEKDFTPEINKYGVVGRLESDDDKILSLEEALKDTLIDTDSVILIGPQSLAVWKEDNRFYMFDPEERDQRGSPVFKGDAGFACVTWYTKTQDLAAKYLSNLPKAQRKSRFMLSKVSIKDYQALAEDWYNFKALTFNKWILRGNFSQQDRRFSPETRNSQCTANATMALCFKELHNEKDWSTDTIDQCLMNGDDFYQSCIDYLKESGRFKDKYLMVDELKRNFDVLDKRVNLEIDDCLVNGIVNAKSDTGIPNLKKGFEEFFHESDAGIVTANLQSMAVWKKDDTFFYYDSHSRNDKGIVSGYGTACVLRVVNVEDLAKSLMINLGSNKDNFYNISRVVVKMIDLTEDGIVKPPLNSYAAISDLIAILRSNFSNKDKKFGINKGKQTVPMCLAAITFNSLTPSFDWTKEDADEVLQLGDDLYSRSMEANFAEDVPEDKNVDEVTTLNVHNELKIGPNSFSLEFEDVSSGNFTQLGEALESLNEKVQEEGNEAFQTILESPNFTVSMWKDDNLIYLFDPRPRDESGQVYGKDEWSVVIPPEPEPEPEPVAEEAEKKEDEGEENKDELAGGDNLGEPAAPETPAPAAASEEIGRLDYENEEAMGEEEEEAEPVEKKGSEYWRNVEDDVGKACVLRFSKMEDLVKHILENTPPAHHEEIEFTLKTVKLSNTTVLHEVFDPEEEEKTDELAGDWNEFKEVDYGHWILRGDRNYLDGLFPSVNQGKQALPMCIVALAYANLYKLSKFDKEVVNNILVYGDRLCTVVGKLRFKELKSNKNLSLKEEEIELILKDTTYAIKDYPSRFCMGENMTKWEVYQDIVKGDINSKNPEEVPNILAGLRNALEAYRFILLISRQHPVAIWRHDEIFYMFDAQGAGPSGVKSPIGVACISRFKDLDSLVKIYRANLPEIGDNFFEIHGLQFDVQHCERQRHPEEKPESEVQIGGFKTVIAGKSIVRGDVKQDYTKFDRGVHVHSAAIAFVALALSLCKDPTQWTRLIVNEILQVGEELHNDTLEKLGSKFNPWADRLDIRRVNTDFVIGKLRVNCCLRFKEQKGIVDIKNSKTPNLRQGLERFFEENSHGVFVSSKLILPIWEHVNGKEVNIFLFDPNSRGATGLPGQGGTACLMRFLNARLAAEHIMACMTDVDKTRTEFTIVPIEIVVGTHRTKRKTCEPKVTKSIANLATTRPELPVKTLRARNVPVTCPTKSENEDNKKLLRKIAEEQRAKKEAKKLSAIGRVEMYVISANQAIVRGNRAIARDRELPVNLVAFVFMKIATDLGKWNYKHIELILEAGYQLYVDSFNAYKPDSTKLSLQHVLRRVLMKDFEVKFDIKKPILGNKFTKENLLKHLTNFFTVATFCMLTYDEFLVSVYFKGGYYYLFDPYARDMFGNKTEKGSAMLMRFGDLGDLVDKVVQNLTTEEPAQRYALIVVGIVSVESLVK